MESAAAVAGRAFDEGDLFAARAVARAVPELAADDPTAADAARGVLGRVAASSASSAGLRGASLGALWSMEGEEGAPLAALAERTTAGIASDVLGEYLSGLAVVAREQMQSSSLLDAVDARVVGLEEEAFLVALPALRRAFAFFPPRERLRIAKRVIERAGVTMDAGALLERVELDPEAARVERALFEAMERYGLLGRRT